MLVLVLVIKSKGFRLYLYQEVKEMDDTYVGLRTYVPTYVGRHLP